MTKLRPANKNFRVISTRLPYLIPIKKIQITEKNINIATTYTRVSTKEEENC